MKKILVILGQTAVGKSQIAFELAQKLNAEIISADSMKVYKYMDIGTSKPSLEQKEKVFYHFIDIILPNQKYSAAQFEKEAKIKIEEIEKKEKSVIVEGGTGLYIKALTQGLFIGPAADFEIRKKLLYQKEKNGQDFLYQKLKEIDPIASSKIHPNDLYRIIRALEVYEISKKPISEWQLQGNYHKSNYEFELIGLLRKKENLYKRIENRVDEMIEQGLVDEVKKLMELEYLENFVSIQGLGYKEIIGYLKNIYNLEESIDLIKHNTKLFAKRQLTWFKKDKKIKWVEIDNINDFEIIEKIEEMLK
ncbi:MAG: tRNA (adenosine(37)-N6)-dimethylallyltransferase MiaA [bacterium]